MTSIEDCDKTLNKMIEIQIEYQSVRNKIDTLQLQIPKEIDINIYSKIKFCKLDQLKIIVDSFPTFDQFKDSESP